MLIGQRIRSIRKKQQLSLGEIQKRVGLMRTYVSRVERGRTIPSLPTLQKLAFALRVPMYRLFFDGPPPSTLGVRPLRPRIRHATLAPAADVARLRRLLSGVNEADRKLLLATAQQMARMLVR